MTRGSADSVATPPRRTGIETGADKRNKALTMLGLAEKVQTQKSPPISRGAKANIVSLGFLLTFVNQAQVYTHCFERGLDAVKRALLFVAQAIGFVASLVKRGQFLH